MCVSHTKRVGENKSFYNCKSSQTLCSLVLSKKKLLFELNIIIELPQIAKGLSNCSENVITVILLLSFSSVNVNAF